MIEVYETKKYLKIVPLVFMEEGSGALMQTDKKIGCGICGYK